MQVLKIGRDPSSSIFVKDETNKVSRFHAELVIGDDGSYAIIDRSTNGVFINNIKIKPNITYHLYPGDNINLAGVVSINWSEIEAAKFKRTKAGSLMRNFVGEVLEVEDKLKNIRLYYYFLGSPSDRIYASITGNGYLQYIEPYKFYSFGLAIYFFILLIAIQKEVDTNEWLELLMDYGYTLLITLALVINMLVSFFFFKTFTGQQKSRSQYLKLSALHNGFILPQLALLLWVSIVVEDEDTNNVLQLLYSFLNISIWIKLNKLFWGLNYLRTSLIYISMLLIVAAILGVLVVALE